MFNFSSVSIRAGVRAHYRLVLPVTPSPSRSIAALPLVSVGEDNHFRTVMQWAEQYKRMLVLANAETHEEIEQAGRMGAEGIGLCRTENMFCNGDRIDTFRRMILAPDVHERSKRLLLLQPLQQQDFPKSSDRWEAPK